MSGKASREHFWMRVWLGRGLLAILLYPLSLLFRGITAFRRFAALYPHNCILLVDTYDTLHSGIPNAIRIAKEFNIRLTLDHCTDGERIADELAEEQFPVLVGPSLGHKSKIELINQSFTTPGVLSRAGLCVSIITDAPVIPLQYLPLCAGLAARAGLDREEAWRAITINPARSLGVDDRVGSLEVGKDADLVIWTSDPLEKIGGEASVTVIDGQIVYRET